MSKKYFWWQAKRWLPLAGTILAILLISQIPVVSTISVDYVPNEEYYLTVVPGPTLIGIGIPAALVALAVPFFVNAYRYSVPASDAFLQLPLGKGELRRVRTLLGWLSILVPFTLVFWLGVIVLASRQAGQVYRFHYEGFFYAYLYLVYGITVVYLAECVFTGFGNTLWDAVLFMAIGQFLMAVTVLPVVGFVARMSDELGGPLIEVGNLLMANLGVAYPIATAHFWLEPYIDFGQAGFPALGADGGIGERVTAIVYASGYAGAGLLAFGWLWLGKEPDGKGAGRKGTDNPFAKALPHVAMGIMAWLLAMSFPEDVLGQILTFLFYFAGYYLLTAVVNRDFKPARYDWLPMGINSGMYAVLCAVVWTVLGTAEKSV